MLEASEPIGCEEKRCQIQSDKTFDLTEGGFDMAYFLLH